MPELPEVQTIVAGLKKYIPNQKIVEISISGKRLRLPYPKNLQILKKQRIKAISRRARYILIDFDNAQTLLIHLGMTGKLIYLKNPPNQLNKHDHFVVKFNDHSCLIYNDVRRFGLIDLLPANQIAEHKMLRELGPEPLSQKFNSAYLSKKISGKSINIKTAMMDNKIVVGVGNIYINESLFESKISPLRPANSLEPQEVKLLVKNIKKILKKAIKLGGSTLRDYVQLNGDVGEFQQTFKVYGRDSQNCLNCSGAIERVKQNGRSSFYCSTCQK